MSTFVRTPQQQNDRYMDGARDIKKLAHLVGSDEANLDIPTVVLVCTKELKYLQDELTSLDVGDIHFVLRGRLQYLVFVLNTLCNVRFSTYF